MLLNQAHFPLVSAIWDVFCDTSNFHLSCRYRLSQLESSKAKQKKESHFGSTEVCEIQCSVVETGRTCDIGRITFKSHLRHEPTT